MLEIRIGLCIAMLALAAIIDLRKREIPDKIWIGFGGAGLAVVVVELLSGNGDVASNALGAELFRYILDIGIISAAGYGIYRSGLVGGADSKALIVVAVLLFSFRANYSIHDLPALTVLTNAVMLSLGHLVYNAARNLADVMRGGRIFEGFEAEGGMRKALAVVTGFRTDSRRGFLFAMEEHDESGKKKFLFNPAAYGDFVNSEKAGRIWVTQALPFIVYITLGFLTAVFYGDLMGTIIRSAIGA